MSRNLIAAVGNLIVNDFLSEVKAALDGEMETKVYDDVTFKPGVRIQFYRKGWADKGENEPTLAINGTIRKISKTGVATVDHRWGVAFVNLVSEKLQVLQQRKSKADPAETDAVEVEGTKVVDGHHRARLAAKNSEYAKVYGSEAYQINGETIQVKPV